MTLAVMQARCQLWDQKYFTAQQLDNAGYLLVLMHPVPHFGMPGVEGTTRTSLFTSASVGQFADPETQVFDWNFVAWGWGKRSDQYHARIKKNLAEGHTDLFRHLGLKSGVDTAKWYAEKEKIELDPAWTREQLQAAEPAAAGPVTRSASAK